MDATEEQIRARFLQDNGTTMEQHLAMLDPTRRHVGDDIGLILSVHYARQRMFLGMRQGSVDTDLMQLAVHLYRRLTPTEQAALVTLDALGSRPEFEPADAYFADRLWWSVA